MCLFSAIKYCKKRFRGGKIAIRPLKVVVWGASWPWRGTAELVFRGGIKELRLGPAVPHTTPPLRNPPQAFRCFAKESCAASRYPEFDTRGFRSCAHACAYTTLQLHFLLSVCHFRYRGTVATSPGLFRKGLRLVKIPLGLFHRAASKCRNALKCTHRVDTADR